MNEEKQREAVEEIVGSLSPKPKEVYYEAAHGIFDKMTMNRFVTPYLLRELFTPLAISLNALFLTLRNGAFFQPI